MSQERDTAWNKKTSLQLRWSTQPLSHVFREGQGQNGRMQPKAKGKCSADAKNCGFLNLYHMSLKNIMLASPKCSPHPTYGNCRSSSWKPLKSVGAQNTSPSPEDWELWSILDLQTVIWAQSYSSWHPTMGSTHHQIFLITIPNKVSGLKVHRVSLDTQIIDQFHLLLLFHKKNTFFFVQCFIPLHDISNHKIIWLKSVSPFSIME